MTAALLVASTDAIRQGCHDLASRLLRRALVVEPDNAAAARDFAALLIISHDLPAADRILGRAIAASWFEPTLWLNLVVIALRSGSFALAAQRSRRVIALDPASIDGLSFLGAACGPFDDDASMTAYWRALAVDPHARDARLGIGARLLDRLQTIEAIRHSRILLALAPTLAAGFGNLTVACWGADLRRDAEANARRGLALDPGLAQAAWILAQARLALGDYARGLGLLEARWGLAEFRAVNGREFRWRVWRGEVGSGLRLLVWAEQGFGDALQFLRYVPILKSAGVRVVLEVMEPLLALVASLGVEVVRRGDPLPEVDAQVALMSLPHLMGTRLETIPAEVPYLAAPSDRLERWRDRLAAFPGPRIGLNWQGNPTFRRDRERSPGFEPIRPLLDTRRLIGLVRDPAPEHAHPNLVHLGPGFADFADTAACLQNLDLVITSDTALAHLAGALARPTWLLLHHAPDWRWLEHRSDSPWYPTLRLFRQPTPGDWASVVANVAKDLESIAP